MEEKQEFICIEEFAHLSGVKESTIRKNRNRIPGLTYESGQYTILEGTRYPYNLRNAKLKDSADRRYYLMDAITKYKYIDNTKLRLTPDQFNDMLQDLETAGLIKKNKSCNRYGANGYDFTSKGEELLKKQKKEATEELTKIVSSAIGQIIGAAISELTK